MMRFNPLLLGAAILLSAMSARADFIILKGDKGTDENVLIDDGTGTTVTGTTNQSGTGVSFTSAQTLVGNGGQARVEAEVGDVDDAITFALTDAGYVFTAYSFNAFSGEGEFSVTVNGFDQFGNAESTTITELDSSPLELGNGENRYTVQSINGQVITSVVINLASGSSYRDLRQNRVGGVTQFTPVPEPASIAMVGLAGLVGLGVLARRRMA